MSNRFEDEKVVDIGAARAIQWFGKMLQCVNELGPEERAEFDKWDRERPVGVATSDWPGFVKYLPTAPYETIY